MGKIAVDIIALVVYAIVSLPTMTGVALHEWLGLAVIVVLFAHCVQHYDWVARAIGRTAKRGPALKSTGRVVLDVAIVVALAVVVVSGIMESGAVLAALGFYAEGYYFWNPLHATAAKVLLALLVVHIALDAGMAWRVWKHKHDAADELDDDEDDEDALASAGSAAVEK